jgi:hypothetical protein
MSQTAYPLGSDLATRLASAGLVASTDLDLDVYAEVGKTEFETAARRVMLAGDSETRRYDPPTNSTNTLRPDDLAVAPTEFYCLPTNGTRYDYTEGVDYVFEPKNATAKGVPIERIVFLRRCWGTGLCDADLRSLYITTQFGYGLELENMVWNAMVLLACAALVEEAAANEIGLVTRIKEGGIEEQYGMGSFTAVAKGWTSQAQRVVSLRKKAR